MRLRSLVVAALVGSALALIPAAPVGATTAPYTLSGLWPAMGTAPDFGYLPALFQWQGKHVAIVNIFSNQATETNDITRTMNDIWSIWHGIPMLSYGAPVPSAMVASGGYDSSDFGPLIDHLKTFIAGPNGQFGDSDDRRVYFRYGWEPNVSNMAWSPCSSSLLASGLLGGNTANDYIAAWRHVHDLFTAAGLDNTRVAWIYSVATGDSCPAGRPEATYPGSSYVDWLGMDVYSGCGESVTQQIAYPPYQHEMLARLTGDATHAGVDPSKPVGFNEAGVSSYMHDESPTAPLSNATALKNQWITDYWNFIHNNNIRMAVWFNSDKGLNPSCDEFEKPWAYFGPRFGDEAFTDGLGTPFHGFSAYRIAIQQPWVLDTDTHNPRFLTDA